MANSCASTIGCDMPPLRGWGSVCPFLLQTWRSYGAEKERGARLEGIQRSVAESRGIGTCGARDLTRSATEVN